MIVLVTGASGFLGRYVVGCLIERGHEVRAMVRPAAELGPLAWSRDGRVRIVRCDLRSDTGLTEALQDVEVVVHLAAAKSGSLHAQLAGTLGATENLLRAMENQTIRRLVLTSSFAVYDYGNRRSGRIDETADLEPDPASRDAYCQTKMAQVQGAMERSEAMGLETVVLRPGVIYGPGQWWTARLGLRSVRGRPLIIGGEATLPLTYVEHCAEAVALAVESPAAVAAFTNRFLFGGSARVPGVLVRSRANARFRPMVYDNRRLKQTLGWRPTRTAAQVIGAWAKGAAHESPEVVRS